MNLSSNLWALLVHLLTLLPEDYFWTTDPENTILSTFRLTILPWVFILHRRAFELLDKKWLALMVTFLAASAFCPLTSYWNASLPISIPPKYSYISNIEMNAILLYILYYNRLPCLCLCWLPARMYSVGTTLSTYFLFAPQTVEGSLICDSFPDFNSPSTLQKLVISSLCSSQIGTISPSDLAFVILSYDFLLIH